MKRYNTCGVPLRSGDVTMLRSLIREYCESRQCERQGAEAEDAARKLVWWFQRGMTDKESLRCLLLPPQDAKPEASVILTRRR